jgi:hypothetical protein
VLSLRVIGGATSGAAKEEEKVDDWRDGGRGEVALCGWGEVALCEMGEVDLGGREEPWNVLCMPRRDVV